jgi:UDP-glucose 4-epimerase
MAIRIAILGAGFIGKNLIRSYLGTAAQVSVLDHKPCPGEFRDLVQWHQGALENPDDVLRAIARADIVFHLISSTVPADLIDETREIMGNVVQSINLFRYCVQESVHRLIFVSSASVYGDSSVLPISEIAATDPISSHGIHKLTIEKYASLYRYKHGLDCKIARLSNPYGWGQDLFGRQGFISIVIGKIIRGEPVHVMGDGSSVRDYIYIQDVVRAFHLLASTSNEGMIFNIGSGVGLSINDVLAAFEAFVNVPIEVRHTEGRRNDIGASVLDITKARQGLGFEPAVRFHEGLEKTLSSYATHHQELAKALKRGATMVGDVVG